MMIRTIAAALAAFVLVAFSANAAEETKPADTTAAPKSDMKDAKAHKKAKKSKKAKKAEKTEKSDAAATPAK
ncbi:MAG TPA: hypothetical protein VFP52_00215 [Myxococcales bacterium]|nr:hypothetical protein [Myxococcales bacterium]